jgi:hypothetical protein
MAQPPGSRHTHSYRQLCPDACMSDMDVPVRHTAQCVCLHIPHDRQSVSVCCTDTSRRSCNSCNSARSFFSSCGSCSFTSAQLLAPRARACPGAFRQHYIKGSLPPSCWSVQLKQAPTPSAAYRCTYPGNKPTLLASTGHAQ